QAEPDGVADHRVVLDQQQSHLVTLRQWLPPARGPRGRAGPSGRRNEVGVVLVLALELEERVVAAGVAVRIRATHGGPGLVDGARSEERRGGEEGGWRAC